MFFCFRRYRNYEKVTDISKENKIQKPIKRTRMHYLLRRVHINRVPYLERNYENIKIELRETTKP